jgi:hypothetical protein
MSFTAVVASFWEGGDPIISIMFTACGGGFSIAMGNSSNVVNAQANAVTDSNENEGFAKAVRKFVLPPAAHDPPRLR